MAIIYLLVSVCLLCVVSKGQEVADTAKTEVEMPDEGPPENSEDQSERFTEDQSLDSLTLNMTQGGCDVSIYMMWQKLTALTERLEDTNRRLEASEVQLAALNQGKPQVAFTAIKPVDGTITAGNSNFPIVYKHIVSNIGNAYSPVSGHFTAPVRGVYKFSFTSFFWGDNAGSGGSLFHNRNKVVSWYGNSQSHSSSGSNTAILQLQVGDKVNVCLWPGRKLHDNGNNYCSFSGFLLF